MKREKPPVIVVGGSAAGFYIAHRLARAGMPVRVYEAADVVNPARRTLIVTDKFREQMGELAPRAIINEIRTFDLFANGDRASIQLERPDLIIERTEVIKVLAEQARQAGAEVLTRQRLVGLGQASSNGGGARRRDDHGGGAIRLTFQPTERRFGDEDRRRAPRSDEERRLLADDAQDITADVVVGADGAFSTVARLAGWPQQPTVPLVQAIVNIPDDMPADSTRVWFVPEDTPFFYWLIPDSDGRGALGVIGGEMSDGKTTKRNLERFLDRQGLEPLEFQAGKIPLYVKWIPVHRKLGKGDVYLAGDSAGQVKVTTVGGIVTGFRGAAGIAEALLHGNGNGGTNGQVKALRRELDLHLLIRRAMHDFSQSDYSRLLELLTPSVRSSLGRFHRDETWRLMRNLMFRQPKLMALGVRNLLRRSTFGTG